MLDAGCSIRPHTRYRPLIHTDPLPGFIRVHLCDLWVHGVGGLSRIEYPGSSIRSGRDFRIEISAFLFPKHLRRERGDYGVRVAPTAGLEPGFATGVIEECLPIPIELSCHLRQEEAARRPSFEQDPIPAHDHLVARDASKAAAIALSRTARHNGATPIT
jgi:hypothetical protein